MKTQQAEVSHVEQAPLPFLHALGDHVHWASGGQVWAFAWQILQQRLTVSMVSEWREYLLIAVNDPVHAPVWVHEADLTPWHGRQP